MSRRKVVLDTRVVHGSGGGPDKTILNSPRFFQSTDYEMLCAYMHSPTDAGFEQLQKKADRLEAPLISVPDRGPWDVSVITRMLTLCRKHRVAIWHGHDYKSNALGLLLKRFWSMRLVTTVHGWVHHTNRTGLYYKIDRLCLPRYELVLCVSPDLHEECLKAGVPTDRCALLENGIDIDDFSRKRTQAEARAELGLARDVFLIGGVGRLSAEKGFDVLLRALHMLREQGVPAELALVGEGVELAALRQLAQELNLTQQVHFLGYRADPRSVYEALDVFALSSYREGLPNVLLEAMALGTPVVSTRINGVPRLVTHEVNGLLLEAGQPGELAAGLSRLWGDAELRTKLVRAGRETIEQKYSFAQRIDKLAQLYDVLLHQPEQHQQPGTKPSARSLSP